MCFFITLHVKETIAKRNITFYKLGYAVEYDLFRSCIKGYAYAKDKVQHKINLQPLLPTPEHTKYYNWIPLNREHKYYLVKNGFKIDELPSIQEGYHGYLNVSKIKKNNSDIGKFIIPKGTRYFYNEESNLLVAETCYWTGRCI